MPHFFASFWSKVPLILFELAVSNSSSYILWSHSGQIFSLMTSWNRSCQGKYYLHMATSNSQFSVFISLNLVVSFDLVKSFLLLLALCTFGFPGFYALSLKLDLYFQPVQNQTSDLPPVPKLFHFLPSLSPLMQQLQLPSVSVQKS